MSSDQLELDPVLVDQIRAHVWGQQLGLMGMFVGLSVLVYDFFITLAEEIELVWTPRPHLSLAKCIYFLNRYFVLFATIYRAIIELSDQVVDRVGYMTNPPPCSKLDGRVALNWITVANWVTIETMLILCVYALWEQSKRVGVGLAVLVTSLVTTAIMLRNTKLNAVVSLEPEWLFPCQAWEPVTRFWLYVMGTGIQVCVFIMFLWKAQRAWRPGTGTPGTRLNKTLWIYCIMYYSTTLALMGVGIAAPLVTHMYLPIYTAQVVVPTVSLVALRLCLSLRQIFSTTSFMTMTYSNGLERSDRLSLDPIRPKLNHIESSITFVSSPSHLSGYRRPSV